MNSVPYHEDWGDEHIKASAGLCEWCGSPVNRHGEAVIEHGPEYDDLTKQAVQRIVLRLWDYREVCEVMYYRIILGHTTGEIGAKLGKTKQAINHLLVKGVKMWPDLERLLFERNNQTKNKKAKRKARK
jgi:hypothetical protein